MEHETFEKVPLNDKQVVSSDMGAIGCDFCDDAVDAFYGCMIPLFMQNPKIVEKPKENWMTFVKTYIISRLLHLRENMSTEFDEEEFTKYTDAVRDYWKADSATLYGTDEWCGVTCIMSK